MASATLMPPPLPSVASRTLPVAAGAPVVGIHFLETTAVFVLGEEALLFATGNSEPRRVSVHAGGILTTAADDDRIVTGGDDGKVVATTADMTTTVVTTDPKHRWVDHVAIAPDGTIAWSAGKEAYVESHEDQPHMILAPSSVGGLAFAPEGLQLAIAHYGGVTLWLPSAPGAMTERLDWKGSHLDVAFSPDGNYLITAMQEPALHGWRLFDGKHMQMTGYATKVRATSWGHNSLWLATSGATTLIVWPFDGEDGPMGKQPQMLAPSESRVTAVACHPLHDVIATGYDDGLLLLVRVTDGAEILARRPSGSPLSALRWDTEGKRLAFGTEDGDAGILDLG